MSQERKLTGEGVAAKNSETAQQKLPAYEVLAEEIKRSWDSRRRIVGMLVESKNNDLILQLIDNGCLKTSDVKGMFHRIDSDSLLYELAVRSSDYWEVVYLFRFIADKEVFRKMIEENGQVFKRFQELARPYVLEMAKKFLGALENEPELYEAGSLTEHNKFVVGIPSDENKIYISWSSLDAHESHTAIVEQLSLHAGKEFPDHLCSGGWIHIFKKEDAPIEVIISGASEKLYNYSDKVLEKFRSQLLRVFCDKLESNDIQLKIEVSH